MSKPFTSRKRRTRLNRRQPVHSRQKRRARLERLEDRHLLAATPIQVLAAGLSGTESVALEVAGVEVQRWANVGGDFSGRQFVALDYTHPTTVGADDVVVRMVNSGGPGKDVRVDGVLVDGVKYESEAPTTWNTGAYSLDFQAITPAFAQSEVIYSSESALYFSSGESAEVAVRAAGATGLERMQLLIDNQVVATWDGVGGDPGSGAFETYSYTHPTKLTPDRVRVAFVNDSSSGPEGDRNLVVDALVLDGRRYESESSVTFGTGTWLAGSIVPGFGRGQTLHTNGYFQYSGILEGGSNLVVWAAGATGEEQLRVVGDGAEVAALTGVGGSYDNREFVAVPAVHPRALTLDQIVVEFLNDGAAAGGGDRNLRVDAVELDGVRHEAEDISTYSTGTWRRETGVQPGFVQDERLHTNGAFQFGQDPAAAGRVSLGATQYRVDEDAGFVDLEIVRTGGTRGSITVDYTTVDGVAIAGEDYTATSGTAILADGAASATVRVPITGDAVTEGDETFNFAADRITGGAFLGQPRTATVTIAEPGGPVVGQGIGLLGEYFSDETLTNKAFERTDARVDFDWGAGAPRVGAQADNFSVRWTGQVQPQYSGLYTFETRADDGVRLWVNGVQLVDAWVLQDAVTNTGAIELVAGQLYDIRMEMFERAGNAVAELRWSSDAQPREIIPTTQLYSDPIDPGTGQFVAETVIESGLQFPTALEFQEVAGAEYLFIAQQDGQVKLAVDGVLQSQVVVDYRTPVNFVRDRGLIGMTVHPDLVNNPYLYLLYTYDPPETQGQSGLAAPDNFGNRVSRLSRLTLDAATGYRTVVPGSDVVLLGTNSTWENISRPDLDSTDDNSIPPSGLLPNGEWVPDILVTDSQSHSIGGLDFGPDGSLYVTNGDGTSYGRVDPRTTRVQDLDSLSGKVLRIDPLTGQGYADNPFFTGDATDDRSKVFNYGLRNPFRIAVDPTSGLPYVGDVGWTRWEEINVGRGENFGWPYYEGGAENGLQGSGGINRQTGGYRNLPEARAFYESGGDSLAEPPLWSRSHDAGAIALVLGDFYTGNLYPSTLKDTLFFTDFGDPTIRALEVGPNGEYLGEFTVADSIGTIVEMSMGLDGRMYFADITGKIGRINYTLASAATAAVQSTPEAPSPLLAAFAAPAPSSADETPLTPSRAAASADDALALLLIESAPAAGETPSDPAPLAAEQQEGDRDAIDEALLLGLGSDLL